MVIPVKAPSEAVKAPPLPPAQVIVGTADGLYPMPECVMLIEVTAPFPSAAHVPAKPVPTQLTIPEQVAVAVPPFVYPVPAVLTAIEATPSAEQTPPKPVPVHPAAAPVQVDDAAPPFA